MVDWTDKRVERLKLLFKEGYSASAIAESLGADFTTAGRRGSGAGTRGTEPASCFRPWAKTQET
jgi:hypothetical protein